MLSALQAQMRETTQRIERTGRTCRASVGRRMMARREEIAALAAYLASDERAFTTGQFT
jgi:NAD(P)-dependent dehydrogenase (short-subunit alcohol dehydrogenase family)